MWFEIKVRIVTESADVSKPKLERLNVIQLGLNENPDDVASWINDGTVGPHILPRTEDNVLHDCVMELVGRPNQFVPITFRSNLAPSETHIERAYPMSLEWDVV